MNTHSRGDIAEMKIAVDAMARGYKVSIPFGHDTSYDLVIDIDGEMNRVQVKCVISEDDRILIPGRSIGKLEGNSVRRNYTKDNIDWIAVLDERTDNIYYIGAEELGPTGKDYITLRLKPTLNNQVKGIRWAKDFTELT